MLLILSAALPLALLAVYSVVCVLALRPRRGTLEWIARYRFRAAPLPGRAAALTGADAGFMALAALIAAAVRYLAAFAYLAGRQPMLLAAMLLENVAAPAVGAALLHASCKRLCGRSEPAFLAAALAACDLAASPAALGFSAAGFFFLARFLTAEEDASFPEALPSLLGCFAFLGAGLFFDGALVFPIAAALIAVVSGCVGRRVRTGRLWPLGALPAALIAVAAAAVLVHVPAGMAEGLRFPQLLVSQRYYAGLVRRVLGDISPKWWLGALLQLQYDWFLVLAGLAAAVAELVGWVRRRDALSGLLLLWTLAQAAALLLSGSHALSFSCALCLGHLWTRLQRHGKSWLSAVGAASLLLLFLGQNIILLLL